jgi:phosphoribosylanthranilate isomerase
MPLKTVVKVGNISNLSDARYCSGMGVDMLGFSVIEGQDHYIPPKLFQEIRGWISGPKVVAEIDAVVTIEQLSFIMENYAPDYFQLPDTVFKAIGATILVPCLITVPKERVLSVSINAEKGGYLLVDSAHLGNLDPKAFLQPVLATVKSADNLLRMLDDFPVSGIAISGSPEIRPGFKDYNQLADILELLDE